MSARLPDPDWPVARPFWEGCARGELRIPRCRGCGRFVWYPAPVCGACGGRDHDWTRVSGRGRVFTWVVVHRALGGYVGPLPYVTALVELEEDARVRLATSLRDVPGSGLRIGTPVEVVFEVASERVTLPAFRCVVPPTSAAARGRAGPT
jgi:uncharacterized OB-fold protein